MLLSDMFNNKLNADLVDSSNKENIISQRQNRNATSSQILAKGVIELLVTLNWKRGL